MRQRAERAMGRGVAVTADDGGAGQRKALLRADDVDHALALVELVVIGDAELAGVLGQRRDLFGAFRIGIGFGAIGGRHVVVDHGQRLLRRVHLAAGGAQPFERLRRGHFVHQMAVDIEQAGAVLGLVHQMVVPDLVVQRGGFGQRTWCQSLSRNGDVETECASRSQCGALEARQAISPAVVRRPKNRHGRRLRSSSTINRAGGRSGNIPSI